MTQVNVKGALGKNPSASGPEVWNRKKMIAPHYLELISQINKLDIYAKTYHSSYTITYTVTVSNPLHTSTNTESMPEATATQSPTSTTVTTSTRTVEDHVEESDVVQTISTRADGRLPVIVINKM
ncbi:hypothetical protein L1887_14923 [Cichorium endivia]|nr:hypothetical protein L1887_14923 [Cichorium endivia]